MFTAAASAAFASAGTALVSAVAAAVAISAAGSFSAKIMAAAEEGFAFSAGKNFRRFFIKAKAGGGIAALFICTVVANKIPVGNFLSGLVCYGDPVRDIVMAFSAVFTSAFMFHWAKIPFSYKSE